MLASSAPTSFVAPFANAAGAGFIRSIPVNSQIGITAGAASLADGYPPVCFVPVAAGGTPPFGQDTNGVLNQISAGVQWTQVGGEPVFNSAFATAIGGYPNGAILQSADGTGFWRSTVDNNTSNPDTGGANWLPMFFSTSAAIALSNANVTLTAAQYSKPIIVLTGTLTAAVALTFPAFVHQWAVINSTTGAFAVTALTSGGTAVTLAQGSKTELRGSGTNVVIDPLQVGAATQSTEAMQLGQATGRWISRVIYAAAGTFSEVPPANATLALYDVNGGGGGGGGASGTVSAQIAAGTGGGAGGRALKRVVNPTTQTVTVGAAGSGASGAVPGGNGGTSSVGALVSATGGLGGAAGTAGTGGTNSGALGGSGVGGDINAPGMNGFGPFGIASLPIVKSGMGGSSPYGQGGLEQTTYATGGAAAGNSAGGAGGSVPPNNAAGASGGAGTPGIVVIDYFS